MTTGAQQHSPTDLPLPEQEFVDSAYERLDALRASYRERQGRVHSTHGVGNAQAWTEREALSAHLGEMAARLEGVEERLVFGRLDMVDSSTRHVGRLSLSHEDSPARRLACPSCASLLSGDVCQAGGGRASPPHFDA